MSGQDSLQTTLDSSSSPLVGREFPVETVRLDFPILSQTVHGHPLVYLDNAATTQKPRQVIDAVRTFYECQNANIHRGVHQLSQDATESYEEARRKVQRFINASSSKEIIFVRGATEGVNLIAQTYGRANLKAGDEVLISAMEHHSNIVPWQLLCEQTGARLRVAPMNANGELILEEFEALVTSRTKLVAVIYVSNALGTVNPLAELIGIARAAGAPIMVDGAQSVPHLETDVQELDVDFLVFSGHKMFGPTGIGIVYGKMEHLDAMPPYQGGGDMISSVSFEKTTFNEVPHKFEAGTPNMAGSIGLAAAVDYLVRLGMDRIESYESELLDYTHAALESIPEVTIIGTPKRKAGVVSFDLAGVHPHDIGTILDQRGIAIRTGHHCAQPVMDFFGVPATARASLSFYNTREEIDLLALGLREALKVFS